ncbi:hypothetical protein R5R35_005030 [Gryllus longicercus]|uniref:Uncharacterized protein n=1 Tax=Gryllus longicercus TaxID=2509291 RepID=A0AAN9VNP4_9ORTH
MGCISICVLVHLASCRFRRGPGGKEKVAPSVGVSTTPVALAISSLSLMSAGGSGRSRAGCFLNRLRGMFERSAVSTSVASSEFLSTSVPTARRCVWRKNPSRPVMVRDARVAGVEAARNSLSDRVRSPDMLTLPPNNLWSITSQLIRHLKCNKQ